MTEDNKGLNSPVYKLEDFETSGWQEAFKEKKNAGYISNKLSMLAQKAEEDGKIAQSGLLRLLADACSMTLRPMSPNMPFRPSVVLRGERSAGPDDFSEVDIDFFQLILSSVTEPWLTARLADLIWLRRRREANIGLKAIDAYVETPITQEVFASEGGWHWMRALRLTRMLKKSAGGREEVIESKLLSACYATRVEDGLLGRRLADILLTFDLGLAQRERVADKMSILATQFVDRKDYLRAMDYYEATYAWYSGAGKEEASFRAIASLAETWCVEANIYEVGDNFIWATQCLEKAIQSYQRIPQKYREILGVMTKSLELRAQLNKLAPRIEENLVCLSVPVEGLRESLHEMAQKARQSVQGKVLGEALATLLGLYGGVNLDSSRARAERELKTFHLGMFGSAIIVSPGDGRVVKKSPSIISAMDDMKAYEVAVEDEMLQHHLFEIGFVANGYILPALETMVIEHRFTEELFVTLCQQAAIVPPKRAKALGRMLFSGCEFDFDDVIHRLVPQMEKIVRHHFRAAGVVTTTIDAQGIENEVNLGALLKKPEAVCIFGKERVFEMRVLFCETPGPKFRHGIAHGLLEDEDLNSPLAAYAWWFALKLTLAPFRNSLVKE